MKQQDAEQSNRPCWLSSSGIHELKRSTKGAEGVLRCFPETLSADVLEKMTAVVLKKAQEHIPVCRGGTLPGLQLN